MYNGISPGSMACDEALTEHLRDFFDAISELPCENRASVAIILRRSGIDSSLEVLLIQRTKRARDPWSAHIALPGGRRDGSDPDDYFVAVRETHEEVGLRLDTASYAFVGRLRDRGFRVATRPTAVLSAFVFLQLDASQRPSLQLREVSSAFWVSLRILQKGIAQPVVHHHVLPQLSDTLVARIVASMREMVGLSRLRMAAVDVLAHAQETVKGSEAPYAVLWGMTLDVLGDMLDVFGLERVDRPAMLPASWLLAGVVLGVAHLRLMFEQFWFRGRRKLDSTLASGALI